MKKYLAIPLFIFGLCFSVQAQEQLTKRQLADRAFEREEYYSSLNLYLKLSQKANPDAAVIERIADCYRLMNDDQEAETWYAKLMNEPQASLNSIYYYAEALLHNQKLKEAKEQYSRYYSHFNAADELAFKLATCDSAAAWMQHPSSYTLKNESRLNSKYSDWGATNDSGNSLIFTSDRSEDKKHKKDTYARTGNHYSRLYSAAGDSIRMLPLETKANTVFSGKYHIGPIALNTSGDTAYITVTTTVPTQSLPVNSDHTTSQRLYTRRLQLIMATKAGKQWGNFKSFPYNNVKEYSVGHAALSKDGRVLYFTSDMPGGIGMTDIWYCTKKSDGTWDNPVNCGTGINTKAEEAFPTVNEMGSLYYSSKGLPGMGGYDIFKAKGAESQWEQPKNLKYPANSTSDDFYLSSENGLTGYLSSNRQGGQGSDDIYSYTYVPQLKLAVTPVHPDTTQKLPSTPGEAPQPEQLSTVIYYELNRADIRPDAAQLLDQLVSRLQAHRKESLMIASFTDSRASAAYNLSLSQRRSAAAVAYLTSKGIAANRLIAKSYGETHLVNQCANGVACTEAQHQLNRRTEITIVAD